MINCVGLENIVSTTPVFQRIKVNGT